MKEATGELNMTVIVVVAIAAVAAFFYAFIWPTIKKNIQAQTICANGPNYTNGTKGAAGYVSCGSGTKSYTCDYTDADGQNAQANCTVK